MTKAELKKIRKKQEIKDSLLPLFLERGIESIKTKELLEKANVANSSFFHFFDNKETLLKEMFIDIMREIIQFIDHEPERNVTLKEYLLHGWNSYIEFAFTHPNQFLFFEKYRRYPTISTQDVNDLFVETSYMSNMYEFAIQNNEISTPDYEYLRQIYMENVSATANYMTSKMDKFDKDESTLLFNMYWKSIKT